MLFPKQLYVRFDSLAGDPRQSLQLGRFLFLDGGELTPKNSTLAAVKQSRINARLIGDFVWSDVGRAFDGVHYSLSTPNSNVTLLAAVPTRGVFQVDGWGWNDIAFAYAGYTHDWGSGRHAADTRVFFIEYDDWRPDLKIDNRPLALRLADQQNLRIDTFGAHTLHSITNPAGPVDLLAWGAVQTGRWGALAQRAYAADLEAGWQPAVLPSLKPWLRTGYTIGSGDGNPNDKTHGTFFQLLPTPRIYARFPFFNMMNTEDLYGMLTLRPHPKLTISSEFHSLRLANPNDLWYSGGGAFQPWTFGYIGRPTAGRRSLGNLYDTNLEYRANQSLTFTAYLGYTQGLAVMEHIYPQPVRLSRSSLPLPVTPLAHLLHLQRLDMVREVFHPQRHQSLAVLAHRRKNRTPHRHIFRTMRGRDPVLNRILHQQNRKLASVLLAEKRQVGRPPDQRRRHRAVTLAV